MRQSESYLFNKYSLSSVIENHRRTVAEKLGKIPKEEIEGLTEDQLVRKYYHEFIINPLVLCEEDIELETLEKDIDVSHRIDLYWSTPGPHYKRGTVFKYYLPVSGDGTLLDCQPSTFTLNPPYALHSNNQLIFEFEIFETDKVSPDDLLDSELKHIREMVERVNKDIQPFNDSLKSMVDSAIKARKEKIAAIGRAQGSSKYKTRSSSQKSLVFPTTSIQSKQREELPIIKSNNKPEPYITDVDYERIIEVIKHTGTAIERNAKTYQSMGEEELRDILLTQLNGHYEGKAAGEAFNAAGKTDILVRDDDKNVFIGECKIWGGGSQFNAAIDQLMGYTAWRDTKTALIVFSRNKSTTAVLAQIDELVSGHKSHKRSLGKKSDTDFRYVLKHSADADKELFLAVIVLDVPAS